MSEEKRMGSALVKHETHVIEKFDMRMEIAQRHEKRVRWGQRFVLENGEQLTSNEVEVLKKSGKVHAGTVAKVVWVKEEMEWVGAETIYTRLFDDETLQQGADVWFYGTSDGPIIATVPDKNDEASEWLRFGDPAHVKYSATGNIELQPIFGVARSMLIHRSALKQRLPLSQIMGEVYLQFVMQNRQFRYELRPIKPIASSMPLDNKEPAPSVDTH